LAIRSKFLFPVEVPLFESSYSLWRFDYSVFLFPDAVEVRLFESSYSLWRFGRVFLFLMRVRGVPK